MKLATTTNDFAAYTSNSIEAIEYVKNAGFKYIDYSFCIDYKNKTGIYSADEDYIEKVIEKVKELDVCLVQAHAPFYSFIFDGDISGLIEDTIKCVRACAKWGIPSVVVHAGYQRNISKEENFRKNKEFLLPILEAGVQYGVKILTENFNKMEFDDIYWIDNATDLMEFIEFVNHPNLYVLWDAGHANLQEMSQEEELTKLGDLVSGLHIHDNYGDFDNHMPPFWGTMSMDSLMQGLFAIGYKGYFTLESENIFLSGEHRRVNTNNPRLLKAPLDLRIKAEALLYEVGKTILKAYDCFEE